MGKPRLSTASIWNMSIGFLGIQMGFALQNGNASRILQTFGADVHELSWFWIVAPLTGMIVQPIIGHYSDRTWTKLGRRRPFFLAGAIVACIGLLLMPNAASFTKFLPALWIGAGMLMVMDASFNVSMEPFRALVGDKLSSAQRTEGFSIQTVLIGIGAVIGSWLPYFLGAWFNVETNADPGVIPPNVIYSFMIGALVLISSILWTVFTTNEYSPAELKAFGEEEVDDGGGFFKNLSISLKEMPKTMRQLGVVQFFSWFGLFGMWVFTAPAVATHIYGLDSSDTSSATFQESGNWVGIIFGVYNGVSALYAFLLPTIAKNIGRKKTHMVSLVLGGLGLISMYFFKTPNMLIVSMIGVGFAWASILAMPYAILAGSIPLKKMGIYMGIFNLFITIPQITNAIIGGPIVHYLFGDQAIFALVLAGVCMFIAAVATVFVEDIDEVVVPKI
ncbi:MAG TPA: MFS transporter [Saprospiraceae bacterium]|nr:MFS transporter [Saprospiraceae bacterium]